MKRYSTTLKNEDVDSVAIGGFDGIHVAHKRLISNLTKNGLLVIIDKKNATLTPSNYRCNHINHGCLFIDFKKIRGLTTLEFITFLKSEFKNLKKIVVGYDFRFGKDALGDAKHLKEIFDGEVVVIDEVIKDGISIHSKVIRKLIKSKKIKQANELLGREYEIVGEVIKGQGLGKEKLFATLNLDVKEFLIPFEGVYATRTKIEDRTYPSVTFIGKRVSTDNNYSIETHILDQELDDVEGEVSIYFREFIRENRRFDNLEALKLQISEDIKKVKPKLCNRD